MSLIMYCYSVTVVSHANITVGLIIVCGYGATITWDYGVAVYRVKRQARQAY